MCALVRVAGRDDVAPVVEVRETVLLETAVDAAAATLPAGLLVLPAEKKPPFMPPNMPAGASFRFATTCLTGAASLNCSLLSCCFCCGGGWVSCGCG